MQISFLLSSLRLSGGVLLVLAYARKLAERNHKVTLVIPAGTVEADICVDLPSTVQIIESKVALADRQTPFHMAQLSLSLAKALPAGDVIVATHTPTVVPALLASILLHKGRRAWLYMDYPEMFRQRPIEQFLLSAAPRYFETIATISQPLAEFLTPTTKANVFVSGCGLPRPNLFRPSDTTRPHRDAQHIFYLGDNRPRKGFQDLLAAIEIVHQEHPNLKLIVASKIDFQIDTPVPYEFHLHPSDQQLAALYRDADLFVSTSWGEGLGYPPLEAMASGTPVVLTDSIGVRDYAVDGENCLLVPARNIQVLAGGIRRALSDPQLSSTLVHNGLATVQRYQWDDAVERFEAGLAALFPST